MRKNEEQRGAPGTRAWLGGRVIAALLLIVGILLLLLAHGTDARVPSARGVRTRHAPATPGEAGSSTEQIQSPPGGSAVDPLEPGPANAEGPGAATPDTIGSIRGRIVDEAGAAVSGAAIVVRPNGLFPVDDDDFRLLSVRSAEDGTFALPTVPRSRHYEVYGVASEGLFGRAYVASGESGAVTICAKRLLYDRYLLSDEEGRAVAAREYPIVFPHGETLLTGTQQVTPLLKRVLAELPWLREVPEAGDALFVIYTDDGATPTEFPVAFPRFCDVVLPVEKRSIAAWPSSSRVTLRRNPSDDRIPHIIEFPALSPALAAYDLDLVLMARAQDMPHSLVVARACPVLWAPLGTTFDIRSSGFEPYEYTTSTKGEQVLVRPRFPAFGYLELVRDGQLPVRQAASAWQFYLANAAGACLSPPVRGRSIRDGLVVFGPLPVGTYSILAQYADGGEFEEVTIGPVNVGNGANVWRWK